MTAGLAWVLAAAAAAATAVLAVPRHRPRRFPDDPEPDLAQVGPARRRDRMTRWPRFPGGPKGPRRWGRPVVIGRPAEPALDDLAACCDLLAVAAASGATVTTAIQAVGDTGRGPVAGALGRAGEDVRRGTDLADAIGGLGRTLGPGGQALTTTLLTAASSGAPPAPGLLRLADSERRRARRRVEGRVRRLPVLLLLPLVGCILPAFVLLTLVPVGLSAARGAGLTAPVDPSAHPVRSAPSTSPVPLHPPDPGGPT